MLTIGLIKERFRKMTDDELVEEQSNDIDENNVPIMMECEMAQKIYK